MAGPFTGAEAAEAGSGTFTMTGGSPLNVYEFSVSEEATTHDATTAGSTHRVFRPGLKTSSGTFVCYHDEDAATLNVGTYGDIVATLFTGRSYTIAAIIEKVDVTWTIDGLCEVTYAWRQTPDGLTSQGSAADYVKA